MGGWSSEREISLQSGEYIAQLFSNAGFNVSKLDVKKDLMHLTNELYKHKPDYIYNALHGAGGEDGTIQGVLEIFGVPYSNSDVLGSAICFNKEITYQLIKAAGINTPRQYVCGSANDILPTLNINKFPFIIKPTCNGSSIGVFIINNNSDLQNIKNQQWHYGKEIIVEDYIKGREFTICVFNGKAIGALEIIANNQQFYNYQAKYLPQGSTHISNYKFTNANKEIEMMEIAEKAFAICKCRDVARIDMIYEEQTEKFYFLEINTQPGETKQSLVPDILKSKNINLLDVLIPHNDKK